MTDQFDAKVTLSKRLKIDPDCNSKSALELVAKKTKVQNKNKQKPSVKFNIKEPQQRKSNDKQRTESFEKEAKERFSRI